MAMGDAPKTRAQEREERNANWRKLYEEGRTLREISALSGGEYPGTISRAILAAGGTMRPTGYPKGSRIVKKPARGLLGWVNS